MIPQGNDKELVVDKKDFENAVDRVSTISSERGRAVKLSLSPGKLVLSVTNPDSGSATEELEVEYASDALDIGFNSAICSTSPPRSKATSQRSGSPTRAHRLWCKTATTRARSTC